MKKYLFLLPLIYSCVGFGKSNMKNGEDTIHQVAEIEKIGCLTTAYDRPNALKSKQLLILFDYDDTITTKSEDRKTILRDPHELRHLINCLFEQGHKVGIATFSSSCCHQAIIESLKKIGLTDDQIENIPIEYGLPPDRNKKGHIYKLKERTGVTNNADVMLIDDSAKNIEDANRIGLKWVYVDKNFYWKKVQKEVDKLMENKN